jgi:hypothetical protein
MDCLSARGKRAQTISFSGPATATETGGRLEGAFIESFRLFSESVTKRTQPMTPTSDRLAAVACQVSLLASASENGREVAVDP